jgi:hypothetical protein
MIKVSRLSMLEDPRMYFYASHDAFEVAVDCCLLIMYMGDLYGETDNPEGARRVQRVPAIKTLFQ